MVPAQPDMFGSVLLPYAINYPHGSVCQGPVEYGVIGGTDDLNEIDPAKLQARFSCQFLPPSLTCAIFLNARQNLTSLH